MATVSGKGRTDPTNHARRRVRPGALPDLLTRLAVLPPSRCREWLERLDCGETGRGEPAAGTDPETDYVAFDRPRVLRVLARIIADLDEFAGYPPIAEEKAAKGEDAETRRTRHRRRLAEPEPPPKRLTMREERAMLRALVDLPPTERG